MWLIFLALIGAPLFLSMEQTHLRFQELFELEKAIISMDNAAIELGRSARKTWNVIESVNRRIDSMELRHHAVHFCAKLPATRVACQGSDILLEARIRSFVMQGRFVAQAYWTSGRLAAIQALKRESGLLTRSAFAPLRARICPGCRIPSGWVLPREYSEQVSMKKNERRFQSSVRPLLEGGKWNYSVEAMDVR